MSSIERCTCKPYWQDAGGGYTECVPELDPSCSEHGEVEHILASRRYTDRRGRVWKERPSGVWSHVEQIVPVLGVLYSTRLPDQMRLLIERDQHREECVGLNACWCHPVPSVITSCESGGEKLEVYAAHASVPTKFRDTLPEAMDAARALAVSP